MPPKDYPFTFDNDYMNLYPSQFSPKVGNDLNIKISKTELHKTGFRIKLLQLQTAFFNDSNKASRYENLKAIEELEYKIDNHKKVYPQYYI